jgi:hypothetical protein
MRSRQKSKGDIFAWIKSLGQRSSSTVGARISIEFVTETDANDVCGQMLRRCRAGDNGGDARSGGKGQE